MKIAAFLGSAKKKRSNTYVMVERVLAGARGAGAETQHILLAEKEIHHCLGCLNCWIRTPGRCAIKDDMAEILEIYMQSDIVIMATPLYTDNVSGLTKTFMDRLIPLVDPHMVIDPVDNETRHPEPERPYPGIVAISSCGFPEQSQFQVLELVFSRMARNMQAGLVAEIYRSQGNLLTIPHPAISPIVENYLNLLEKDGSEIVENRKLSDQTKAALDQPLIPREAYIEGANRHWDKQLEKLKLKEQEKAEKAKD